MFFSILSFMSDWFELDNVMQDTVDTMNGAPIADEVVAASGNTNTNNNSPIVGGSSSGRKRFATEQLMKEQDAMWLATTATTTMPRQYHNHNHHHQHNTPPPAHHHHTTSGYTLPLGPIPMLDTATACGPHPTEPVYTCNKEDYMAGFEHHCQLVLKTIAGMLHEAIRQGKHGFRFTSTVNGAYHFRTHFEGLGYKVSDVSDSIDHIGYVVLEISWEHMRI